MNKRYVSRGGVRAGLAVAAMLLAASCGSPELAGSDSGTKDATVEMKPEIRALFPESMLESGVLRVGLSAPSPPAAMLVANKVAEGTDYDTLSAVAALAGLRAEFTPLPFTSVVPSLNSGRTDITGNLVPTPTRTEAADFILVGKVPYGILIAKGNPKGISGTEDLCGRTVAVVAGSTQFDLIEARNEDTCKPQGKPLIAWREYRDQPAAILAVKSGEADAFPQASSVTNYVALTVEQGTTFESVIDHKGIGGAVYSPVGFGVRKGDDQLKAAVQAAMQVLVDSGAYLPILEKYGTSNEILQHITVNELDPRDLAQG
ncbi:transporter substrate-binding domain-containing protein [Rhodococcus sp. NPDC055024]